jgi:hypothetical protein
MPLLSAVLVAAQALTLPAPASPTCSVIDVVDPAQERPSRTRVFFARETVDLELRVRLHPRLSGDHVVRLRLFTPAGFFYQEITVPYRPDAAARDLERRQEYDAARSMPEGQARRRRPPGQVAARLPVAGTAITLGSLYGRWTVVPFLDDDDAPCGRSRRFVIER